MSKFFELSESVYGDGDTKWSSGNYIQVSVQFDKGKGYCLVADAVGYGDGMISKAFCKEYYELYYDLSMLIVPCSRRSKKQEAMAEAYLTAHGEEFAKKWIDCAIERGGKEVTIIKEVK